MGNFRELKVWQQAKDLAVVISMEIEYISSEKYKEMEKICDNICAMLTGLIKHRMK